MGKLLVEAKDVTRILSLAQLGVISLYIIANNNFKKLPQQIREIEEAIATLDQQNLDCSSLPVATYTNVLLVDIQELYKYNYRKLLERAQEMLKYVSAQVDSIHQQGGMSIRKKLQLVKEAGKKRPAIDETVTIVPKLMQPLESLSYGQLLLQAYVGLQGLMQLADTHFRNSRFIREENLEVKLRLIQQEIESLRVDPIVVEDSSTGIPLDSIRLVNIIVNKYYNILLQQANSALERAVKRFNADNFAQYTSAVSCLQAINAAEAASKDIMDLEEKTYYCKLLQQARTATRKSRIKKYAQKDPQEIKKQLDRQVLEQRILLDRAHEKDSRKLGAFKAELCTAIATDSNSEIANIVMNIVAFSKTLDGSGQEEAIIMLKNMISWALEERKILGAISVLDSGRANGIVLAEPLPYAAGWSLLHEIAQLIPSSREEQQQLLAFATCLIKKFAVPVDIQDKSQGTPLFYAANAGNASMAELLCGEMAAINLPNRLGFRPLHVAARNGHGDVVTILLQQPGIDVDILDVTENSFNNTSECKLFVVTELNVARMAGIQGEAVILTNGSTAYFVEDGQIIKTDSNTNKSVAISNRYSIKNAESIEPVLIISSEDAGKIIHEAMSQAGLLTPSYKNNGATPLHYASFHGHVSVVRSLLAAHARTDIVDRLGNTAYDWAEAGEQHEIMELLKPKEIVKIKPIPVESSVLVGEPPVAVELPLSVIGVEHKEIALGDLPPLVPVVLEIPEPHVVLAPTVSVPKAVEKSKPAFDLKAFISSDQNGYRLAELIAYYRTARTTDLRIIAICEYLMSRREQLNFVGRTQDFIAMMLWRHAKDLYCKSLDAIINDRDLLRRQIRSLHLPPTPL